MFEASEDPHLVAEPPLRRRRGVPSIEALDRHAAGEALAAKLGEEDSVPCRRGRSRAESCKDRSLAEAPRRATSRRAPGGAVRAASRRARRRAGACAASPRFPGPGARARGARKRAPRPRARAPGRTARRSPRSSSRPRGRSRRQVRRPRRHSAPSSPQDHSRSLALLPDSFSARRGAACGYGASGAGARSTITPAGIALPV